MDRHRDTATAPATATASTRGLKRTADDSFDDDNRFAKRFNLLNLGISHSSLTAHLPSADSASSCAANNNDKLYIPVSARPQLQTTLTRPPPTEEHMQLHDTKDRVYIHNLDDELADIESDEEKLIFLPDIEKKLNAIPRHILVGERKDSHQELVLYNLPPSLSVPIEQDNVRKAILEARERAKEKVAIVPSLSSSPADGTPPEDQIETAHGYDSPDYGLDEDTNDMEEDEDAMDLS
ncbi:hypothetical protein QM012_008858 [Aureobasidium pullulans]|uniref:Uncharacterized protein n=1 Tax=Aureobasidium pullulans TaxID=5580 RepID=A0ABR0THV0_AURPU